ncbi:HAD-IA family hydrolase [Patescibacteria group bacterium]|nr:HAD-IA family hydrolase [Patescibacteria group bacterium]MBU0964155.1 HAD-IA family hydrolase [Patescibacteria group bacterium]
MYFENEKLDNLLQDSKLVIFDMNGLIVDDEPIQMQAVNIVLKEYGIEFTKSSWPAGLRDVEFFKLALDKKGIANGHELLKELELKKSAVYKKIIQSQVKNIARLGIIEIIKMISDSKNQKLALATSSSKFEVKIILGKDGLDLKNYFEFILTGDKVKNAKPDSEIYNTVAIKMKIPPDECLVFEDTDVGVESAISAGMKCVAVPNEFTKKQDFSKATYLVNNLTKKARIL